MSEKKYYVFLSPLNNGNKPFFQLVKHGFMGELVGFAKCNTKNKNGRYENKYSRFTKSELSRIMGGALYKQTDSLPFEWLYSFESLKEKLGWEFNETIDKWEYTNPLIKLVPVEDGE
ncbi:hypothetical protein EFL99_13060 [Lactococcus lactis]|uniref:hypothetical protein n=1 Tax=Lactococcus lactis TaxID=1358 RepID=UPI00223A9114|nr:hypothetical protein [Lactococcus lactis]MCT1184123.1 hypothetical protein [Lactococcus lactis]